MSTPSPQHACWFNGELVDPDAARVSVFDHGLLYGDGVFEGIRFYNGRAFRLDAHLRRLSDSARAIRLAVPFESPALTEATEAVISASGATDGYVRLVVTRGPGDLGLDPRSCHRPNVFLIAAPLRIVSDAVRDEGARLVIASTRRLAPDGLDPRVKSLNYLNHVLARMEATLADADEALLLNAQGRIAEGTADNVFVVRDGWLSTPPAVEGALEGITRALVLELARAEGIECRESPLTAYDLYTADECFLTGTGAELIPVREVDGRAIADATGPVFRRLLTAFRNCIERETKPTDRSPA
jgi:branched-chain amino acid aminotransferase